MLVGVMIKDCHAVETDGLAVDMRHVIPPPAMLA
jgi:hypothetical protein